jgi:hypothetical protein
LAQGKQVEDCVPGQKLKRVLIRVIEELTVAGDSVTQCLNE